jgi:hypothetical protein
MRSAGCGRGVPEACPVIRGRTIHTKKRVDFQAFMTDLIAEHPPDSPVGTSSPANRLTVPCRL